MFKKKKTSNYSNKAQIIRLIITNICSTAFVLMIGVLLVALIAFKLDLGEDIVYYLTYPIIGITALISAFVMANTIKSKGWLIGLVANAVLLVIITMTHFFLDTADYSQYFFFKIILLLACGVMGGIIGVNHKKKTR